MKFNVNAVYPEFNFYVTSASYAGKPVDNSILYISKKVDYLLENLHDVKNCLVFLENGIDVPNSMKIDNGFVFSDNPQFEYAKFATLIADAKFKKEAELGYRLTSEGYYIGANVKIGTGAYIEPGVVIGHDVTIGNYATILSGAIIKNAIIGDNFYCNEMAAVGTNGFIMTIDENGNKFRIPSLGGVTIMDNVEVGAHNNISRGTGMNTIIENNVKLDALVHIGHDVHINKNAEIVAGSVIGGFDFIGEDSFIGINASLRNRINVGKGAIVGMGAVVTKSIDENMIVAGNPAHKF